METNKSQSNTCNPDEKPHGHQQDHPTCTQFVASKQEASSSATNSNWGSSKNDYQTYLQSFTTPNFYQYSHKLQQIMMLQPNQGHLFHPYAMSASTTAAISAAVAAATTAMMFQQDRKARGVKAPPSRHPSARSTAIEPDHPGNCSLGPVDKQKRKRKRKRRRPRRQPQSESGSKAVECSQSMASDGLDVADKNSKEKIDSHPPMGCENQSQSQRPMEVAGST